MTKSYLTRHREDELRMSDPASIHYLEDITPYSDTKEHVGTLMLLVSVCSSVFALLAVLAIFVVTK